MKNISINEMKKVKGGSINWGIVAAVGAIGSFIVGIFDGWIHPKKCN